MILRYADSQGLLCHTPQPILSAIPMTTCTILYALQNYQTLERFLESLYLFSPKALFKSDYPIVGCLTFTILFVDT